MLARQSTLLERVRCLSMQSSLKFKDSGISARHSFEHLYQNFETRPRKITNGTHILRPIFSREMWNNSAWPISCHKSYILFISNQRVAENWPVSGICGRLWIARPQRHCYGIRRQRKNKQKKSTQIHRCDCRIIYPQFLSTHCLSPALVMTSAPRNANAAAAAAEDA